MDIAQTIQPEKTPIGRPRRIRVVDLDQVQRQLFVVLKRESLRLMDQSFKSKLSQESSKILVNYLKLLKELMEAKPVEAPKTEVEIDDSSDNLTDEELKLMIKKSRTEAKNG